MPVASHAGIEPAVRQASALLREGGRATSQANQEEAPSHAAKSRI